MFFSIELMRMVQEGGRGIGEVILIYILYLIIIFNNIFFIDIYYYLFIINYLILYSSIYLFIDY